MTLDLDAEGSVMVRPDGIVIWRAKKFEQDKHGGETGRALLREVIMKAFEATVTPEQGKSCMAEGLGRSSFEGVAPYAQFPSHCPYLVIKVIHSLVRKSSTRPAVNKIFS